MDLARRGQGQVEPNPLVGAVLVKDEQCVASGWHQQFGGPHAEVDALQKAGSESAGCTLYVTLEPCSHHGKTPPCTDAVIQAGISRVVIGHLDPSPQVNGQGVHQLKAAGLQVDSGTLQEACQTLNAPYLKRLATGTPWVLAKWAMSLDGKIAARDGSSRWISSPSSRKIVHEIRGRMDAIVIGRQTAELDDPQLTARPAGPRTAMRVVMTTTANLPEHLTLIRTAQETPTLITCGPETPATNRQMLEAAGCKILFCKSTRRHDMIRELLEHLGQQQMTNILLEGGSDLLGSWFDAEAIDELHVFLANKLLGGRGAPGPLAGQGLQSMAAACSLEHLNSRPVETDLYLWGPLRKLQNSLDREAGEPV